MNSWPKIPLFWTLVLIFPLPGCISQKYHQSQIQTTKQSELDYAKGLAERVETGEMTSSEMVRFLEERK